MNNDYFKKVTELEEMNVSDDYIIGWQEGYQHATKIEEQRLTLKGFSKYLDNSEYKNSDNFFSEWTKSSESK